jgi:hypothetical protein
MHETHERKCDEPMRSHSILRIWPKLTNKPSGFLIIEYRFVYFVCFVVVFRMIDQVMEQYNEFLPKFSAVLVDCVVLLGIGRGRFGANLAIAAPNTCRNGTEQWSVARPDSPGNLESA